MANYQIMGNVPPEDLFGGKANLELMLRSMNHAKTIASELGAEYNPPLVWNKNLPTAFVGPLGDYIIKQLQKDKLWKPSEEDKEALRKVLKTIVEGK